MILLPISFMAGVLTILAPCVLPLLPIIVGGSINGDKSWKRAITVTMSLAISIIAFTLLIKGSTLFINISQDFWEWFSGSIIIAFGLITLFPSLWEKLPFLAKMSIGSNKILSSGYQKQSFLGDAIVGAALGPVFSTCSPTYFLVLAAVLPENLGLGLLYLVAYAAGLSLSLLLVAFVGQKIVDKAGIAANPHGWFKKTLGVLFLVVGIAIISGADKALQVKLLDAGFFDITKIEQKLLEFVPSTDESRKDTVIRNK
ncbi:MAG: cytochrome c biogenesis protein CcdA [Candidatus Andersenbacteria bacterium]